MTAFLKYGDLVRIKAEYDPKGKFAGKVYRITKVPYKSNEVNYFLTAHGHNGNGVRARFAMLEYVDPANEPKIVEAPVLPKLHTGTVVRWSKDGKLYVTTKQYTDGTYQMYPLGGSTKYWKHVQRAQLLVIDPEILVKGDEPLVKNPGGM